MAMEMAVMTDRCGYNSSRANSRNCCSYTHHKSTYICDRNILSSSQHALVYESLKEHISQPSKKGVHSSAKDSMPHKIFTP